MAQNESFVGVAGLAQIEKHLEEVPVSSPLSILSNENWNPYNQYMMNKNPTQVVGFENPVPAVPEVLCIDLPTGFDASEFSKPSRNKKPLKLCIPPIS